MYASTSACSAAASIRRAPSRTTWSISDDSASPAGSTEKSGTMVGIGCAFPAGVGPPALLDGPLRMIREGTPSSRHIHRFQAFLCAAAAIRFMPARGVHRGSSSPAAWTAYEESWTRIGTLLVRLHVELRDDHSPLSIAPHARVQPLPLIR